MELIKLCQDANEAIHRQPSDWPTWYLQNDTAVRSAVARHGGLKTDVYARFGTDELEGIKVAVVLSDFSSVFLNPWENQAFDIMREAAPPWPTNIRVPASFFNPNSPFEHVEINNGIPAIRPTLCVCTDPGVGPFMRELAPLAESGRLMFRPIPGLLGKTTIKTDGGGVEWKLAEVDPNVPGDTWVVRDHQSQVSLPMKQESSEPTPETQLATLMLPYLVGVSYADIARILDDEEHYLSEFRAAMKDLIKSGATDPLSVEGILQDKVRPATDKVNRRFNQIVQMHSLRIGGAAVATAGAALTAFLGPGLVAAIGALVGVTGVGAITKEIADLLKAHNEMRDMPYYLLWRLRKARRY